MNFVLTANLIKRRTEICGELEAVMFYSSIDLAVRPDLLLFRYLDLLPHKYNLANYKYIKSKCRKSIWACRTASVLGGGGGWQRARVFHTRFSVAIAVFLNKLVMRSYAV